MFDLEEYISANPGVLRKAPGGERVLRECPNCSDRKGRTYVNIKSGRFICHHCGWRGRNPVKLITKVEGINESEARKMVAAGFGFARPKREAIRLFNPEVKTSPGLPEEYVPCYDKRAGRWNGVPAYLSSRGVSKKAMAAFKLGWCERGYFRDRIIFPIITGELISFQARATWTTNDHEPKYDSPKGAHHGSMLIGYHLVKPGTELWIVEGPMDVIGCYQAGLPSLGLIGKSMSDAQVNLIAKLQPAAVHLMLDPEAERDALKVLDSSGLPYLVSVDTVKLTGGDPGDLPSESLAEQSRNTRKFHRSRLISG